MIYPLGLYSGDTSNKFCSLKNLHNESDVEQFFAIRLLNHLGYTDNHIRTKKLLKGEILGKGARRRTYVPDYICYEDRQQKVPLLVIDAKNPLESAEAGANDAQEYAAVLHRRLDDPKPEIYCIGTNGTRTIVKHYDREKPEFDLTFEEFIDGNPKFADFVSLLSRASLSEVGFTVGATFEFRKPGLGEVRGIFQACHNIIWRKEKMSPQAAFYEFCKIMFIKLREDKKLREGPELGQLIRSGRPLPPDRVLFSIRMIVQSEDADPNPINSMLFKRLREELEHEIRIGRKKRIFEPNEEIKLKATTMKEVVRHLEHHDLYGIDEDLNGRLFETFLSSTMRGPELGQFFTPRSVVEFMSDLVDLQVSLQHVDLVGDLCCGTGGFLIEAMAKMAEKVNKPPLATVLGSGEREKILRKIRDEQLLGIDAGKDPPVARIARINMYLHGDGGSHIYFADALDKTIAIEEDVEPELRAEREELRQIFVTGERRFDVALTNPPFAMRYKRSEADERTILEQYKLGEYIAKDSSRKQRASLKSNVMFLERYCDLLKPGGRLCTVIDESVLNTDTDKEARHFLMDNFLVRAVISLPRWAFFEAGSNVKTSILFLTKKYEMSEEQPHTFYARCENIGYDYQKPDPTKNELPMILTVYRAYQKSGEVLNGQKTHWSDKTRFFSKKLTSDIRRIDFEYLDPRHEVMLEKLQEIATSRNYDIANLDDLCEVFRGKTAGQYVTDGIPIIKLRNVTNESIDWEDMDFVLRDFFDDNPHCHLKPLDILLASTGVGTIGRVDMLDKDIPCMTDGHVTVLRLKEQIKVLPRYILYYLRSTLGQMQMQRYTVGSTGQTELNRDDVKSIKIVYSESAEEQSKLADAAHSIEDVAVRARDEYRNNLAMARLKFAELLGLS